MKLSFTTLGTPAWNLQTILEKAKTYGFDGVDFRGLEEALDVTTLPAFTTGLRETKKKVQDAGLVVSGISSSITLCDPARRQSNLEEARRTIPAALGLGAVNIRVFGGGSFEEAGRKQAVETARVSMEDILKLDGAHQLKWVLETHDHWIDSANSKKLLDAIPDPAFGILWDIGHTTRVTEETPAETWAVLGKRVYYTHIKDAVLDKSHPNAMGDGWRYVPVGTGQLPLTEGVRLLVDDGYTGWMVFEHEKRWHPTLPEPDVVMPAYVAWARGVLKGG